VMTPPVRLPQLSLLLQALLLLFRVCIVAPTVAWEDDVSCNVWNSSGMDLDEVCCGAVGEHAGLQRHYEFASLLAKSIRYSPPSRVQEAHQSLGQAAEERPLLNGMAFSSSSSSSSSSSYSFSPVGGVGNFGGRRALGSLIARTHMDFLELWFTSRSRNYTSSFVLLGLAFLVIVLCTAVFLQYCLRAIRESQTGIGGRRGQDESSTPYANSSWVGQDALCCVRRASDDATPPSPQGTTTANSLKAATRKSPLETHVRPSSPQQRNDEPTLALVPDLVIPKGHECAIFIPSMAAASTTGGTYEKPVIINTGQEVFRVSLSAVREKGRSPGPRLLERLELTRWENKAVLACCVVELPLRRGTGAQGGTRSGCTIFGEDGTSFATVRQASQPQTQSDGVGVHGVEFAILPVSGSAHWQFNLQRATSRSLKVTDQSRRIVATVDLGGDLRVEGQDGDFYHLRLGPAADTVLVVIALLAIDRMTRVSDA